VPTYGGGRIAGLPDPRRIRPTAGYRCHSSFWGSVLQRVFAADCDEAGAGYLSPDFSRKAAMRTATCPLLRWTTDANSSR